MSEVTRSARPVARDRIAFAVILIALGAAGLVAQTLRPSIDIREWTTLVVGLGLLAAFAYTRSYGFLIPSGIVTGLGAGIVASEALTFPTDEMRAGPILLGLGLGFVSIYAVGALVHVAQHHWWPLIPGGILTAIGAALLIGGQAVRLLDYWGIGIIALGLFVLWRALAEGRTHA